MNRWAITVPALLLASCGLACAQQAASTPAIIGPSGSMYDGNNVHLVTEAPAKTAPLRGGNNATTTSSPSGATSPGTAAGNRERGGAH